MRDRRMALWCAFALRTPSGTVYFAGDTGYGDGRQFTRAKAMAGPIRMALLPTGAYKPRRFLAYSHMDPPTPCVPWAISKPNRPWPTTGARST